jgi:hypothetical protein
MPRPLTSFDQLDYDMAPTPHQIHEIYDNGFKGVRFDASAYYMMRSSIQRFHQAFPGAVGKGKGIASLPYKAALTLDPGFGSTEAQTTGDCVSHSTRNAGMMDYCIDALYGETTFKGRFATENIYGYRGHGGQGADCSRLANYVSQDGPGGFLARAKYSDGSNNVDLSVYRSSTGAGWGSRGTPDWVNKIAAENKAMNVYALKSLDECLDALAMGFGISMCSGFGFSSKRNEDGVSEKSGGWSHAMAWIGCDDTDWATQKYGGPLILIQNSWGDWNSGGKRHEQPDASFWIKPTVAKSMISNGGGFVITSVRGFDRTLVYDMAGSVAELSRQ